VYISCVNKPQIGNQGEKIAPSNEPYRLTGDYELVSSWFRNTVRLKLVH